MHDFCSQYDFFVFIIQEMKAQPPTELKLNSPNVPSKTPDWSPKSPLVSTVDLNGHAPL